MIPNKFGGDPQDASVMFYWFVNHTFTACDNKISGRSLEIWLDQIDYFCTTICQKVNLLPSNNEQCLDLTLDENDQLDLDPHKLGLDH